LRANTKRASKRQDDERTELASVGHESIKSNRDCNTLISSCFERLGAPLTVAFSNVDGYGAGVIKNLNGFSLESVKRPKQKPALSESWLFGIKGLKN